MDKLTFNGNYKKGKANGGTAVTEALLLLLFKIIRKPSKAAIFKYGSNQNQRL
jgi:hypothetical protein